MGIGARCLAVVALLSEFARPYPLDGFAQTGIRRLAGYKLTIKIPPGGQLGMSQISLRLRGVNESFDITDRTPRDPYLQKGIESIFSGRDPSYSLALLDITDPAAPKYAAVKEMERRIPGSVGKLLIATGILGALRRIHPNDVAARERLLRTMVTADSFVHRDSKTVPFFNDGDKAVVNRRLQIGDTFNLWEWMDHMLSQSSNAAASVCWQQAMLLHRLGADWALSKEQREAFFRDTSKKDLAALSLESLETALTASGIDTTKLRIGTFFTSNAERIVPGTGSYSNPRELLRWLVKMEQGKLVDAWSSLELKRLIYFARPRYRYASSPALNHAAVFFKSGSLFECVPEPGFQCVQYKGNKTNLMHSVTVVESGTKVYLVALTSNVLRLNSAVEHQTIGTLIERLVQGRPAGK